MTVPSKAPRILLADDQRDILEALQLLLKSEGFQVQSVTSPAAVLAAIDETDFDAALIDLNYARDTTSGQEGLDLLGAASGRRSDAAGHRVDRLGERRCRRRGDAPGRARLRPEALGQRPAARHRPNAGGAEPRAAPGAAARRGRAAQLRRRASADCAIAGDEAGDRAHRADGAIRRQRADYRRERHRQGAGRAGDSRAVAARAAADGDGQCRAACPRPSSRASCSATCAAPLPMRARIAWGDSSWPTAERSSSTKSPTCRCRSRRSCCA